MADFVPPTGPPPPKVPEGWVARWNDQYKEWFYVNTFTKKSQWDKPTEPARPPEDDGAPSGPPPSYTPGDKPAPTDTKTNPFANDSSNSLPGTSSKQEIDDAEIARKLQAEEDAKNRSGSAASYAAGAASPHSNAGSPFPNQLPARDGSGDKQRGFLGKLFGKNKQSGGQGYPGGGYGQPQYGGPQYQAAPPPQQYGGYPPQGGYGGYAPQPGYPPQGGYYQQGPPGGYYGGGYPQQQQQSRPSGGGMGMAGGAALGLGAGLIGGMLIEDAIQDHDQDVYQDGYAAGADDGGGDFGGGDF
ncbi:hypothetical protein GQ53DRAFT_749116 [Thozetella sp. PMI_491]|nr:hypothetical protein GQ53DRAFT_749116 [Thozetella sp. PMI_491]